MRLTNRRELYSAGFLLFIGIGTIIGSLNYDIGTLARMGPGLFPLMLGIALTSIAALMVATPLADEDVRNAPSRRAQYRSWIAVSIGMILFVILGKYGGLVPATFTLIVLSALGDRTNSIKAALILAIGVTIVSVGIFHYGLQMQFPLFSWG